MVAATSGDVTHFADARHFSSWFGLTPREYSSGGSRYLGRISKKGTGTCACCSRTERAACSEPPRSPRGAGKEVCGIRRWALDVQGRSNHNKATCAPANKLARICFATLRDHAPFDEAARVTRKHNRQSFVMPA